MDKHSKLKDLKAMGLDSRYIDFFRPYADYFEGFFNGEFHFEFPAQKELSHWSDNSLSAVCEEYYVDCGNNMDIACRVGRFNSPTKKVTIKLKPLSPMASSSSIKTHPLKANQTQVSRELPYQTTSYTITTKQLRKLLGAPESISDNLFTALIAEDEVYRNILLKAFGEP